MISALLFWIVVALLIRRFVHVSTGPRPRLYERPAIDPLVREQIKNRNRIGSFYFCTYCKRWGGHTYGPDGHYWELDHIYPWSRGGTDRPSNLTLACHTCNQAKGARVITHGWLSRVH